MGRGPWKPRQAGVPYVSARARSASGHARSVKDQDTQTKSLRFFVRIGNEPEVEMAETQYMKIIERIRCVTEPVAGTWFYHSLLKIGVDIYGRCECGQRVEFSTGQSALTFGKVIHEMNRNSK